MLLRKCMVSFRNAHNVASHQRTSICARSHKSFPISKDFFDTAPVEELAAKSIKESCAIRKTKGNIEEVVKLLQQLRDTADETAKSDISNKLRAELRKIPNHTHPTVLGYGDNDKLVEIASFGVKNEGVKSEARSRTEKHIQTKTKGKLVDSQTITTGLHIMRKERLGLFCGSRSYYLMSDLAAMVNEINIDLVQHAQILFIYLSLQEQALIRYTTNYLLKNGFHLIAVPDILPSKIIEGCGMATTSDITQVMNEYQHRII